MRHAILVSLACLTACGAPAAAPSPAAPAPVAPTPAVHDPAGPTPTAAPTLADLPAEAAGLRRIGTRRFPDPNAGVHHRYSTGNGLDVDVFVYPVGPEIMREPPGARA